MTTTSASQSSLSAFLEENYVASSGSRVQEETVSFEKVLNESTAAASDAGAGTQAAAAAAASSTTGSETAQAAAQMFQSGMPDPGLIPVQTYTETPAGTVDPGLTAVRDLMISMGLDPDSIQMTYLRRDSPSFDGINSLELLQVQTSDGKFAEFSARMSEESPEVTVCDIRHMIEGTGGWAAEATVS